jgi:hypothetical protein
MNTDDGEFQEYNESYTEEPVEPVEPVLVDQQSQLARPIKTISPEQLAKIHMLSIVKNPVPLENYNLEQVLNKIKDIGKQIQIIRIERKGIIYGEQVWNLLKNIIESSANSNLILELEGYELNVQMVKQIIERMSLIVNPNLEVYPDYYINNLIQMLSNLDSQNLNITTFSHIIFDIGQLEYLINKFIRKPTLPCFTPQVYDTTNFSTLINLIFNIGKTFQTLYPSKSDVNLYYPQMLIKYIQQIFVEFKKISSKYKLSNNNIKLFFEIIFGNDLYNQELYNVNQADTFNERVYKVIYGYLRDDMDSIDDYLLNISYSTLYLMLDLLNSETNTLELNNLIELTFYFGCLFASAQNSGQNFTTLTSVLKILDINSLSILLSLENYLENTVPNQSIYNLLTKLENKIVSNDWTISNVELPINESNIKYVPKEIVQLYCLILPKKVSSIELLKTQLADITEKIKSESFFIELTKSIVLDSLPAITSLVTPDNDLKILGISTDPDINYQDNGEIAGQSGQTVQTGQSVQTVQSAGGKKYKIINQVNKINIIK